LKKHPEGVPVKNFKGTKYNGVNLNDSMEVGAVMRARGPSNPLIYRKELLQYQLMSTAHKTALKTYEPLAPPMMEREGEKGGSFFDFFNYSGK
jgi:hypothetical protein